MVKKICRECKKEFEAKQSYNPRYPRKYCDKCAKERREAYEDIHNVSAEDCEDE
jgi:hypothetical protein